MQNNECDIVVHVDGGCRNHGNKKGQHVKDNDLAAWAYLIEYNFNNKSNDYKAGVLAGSTNNKMEIMALLKALLKLTKLEQFNKNILIISDSKYVLDTIQLGRLNNWKRMNWRRISGDPIKNLALWQNVELMLSEFTNITFKWTKGHKDDKGNIFVDELLNKAMDNY